MKQYVKVNGNLSPINNFSAKVYPTITAMNTDISNIAENEIVFIITGGMYKKEQNSMVRKDAEPIISGAVGDIITYIGTTNPDPDKYLLCNGATFDTTVWPELYQALGVARVPSLADMALKGAGENSGLTNHYALCLCCQHSYALPNHRHTVTDKMHTHVVNNCYHCHHILGGTCTKTQNWCKASNTGDTSQNFGGCYTSIDFCSLTTNPISVCSWPVGFTLCCDVEGARMTGGAKGKTIAVRYYIRGKL